MKCGPKTPAGVVSWGARAASVYLGVLVSAIAVREGASDCQFPETWNGTWYLEGARGSGGLGDGSSVVSEDQFSSMGTCHAEMERSEKYVLHSEEKDCYKCILVKELHTNLLWVLEGDCEPSLTGVNAQEGEGDPVRPDLCDDLVPPGEVTDSAEPVETETDESPPTRWRNLIRLEGDPVECPFLGEFTFKYTKAVRRQSPAHAASSCDFPLSKMRTCNTPTEVLFQFQDCDAAAAMAAGGATKDTMISQAAIENQKLGHEKLTCLAAFDSEDTGQKYLIGVLDEPYISDLTSKLRCFLYSETDDGGFGIAQSEDASCAPLADVEKDGVRNIQMTVDSEAAQSSSEAACLFPAWARTIGILQSFAYSSQYEFDSDGLEMRVKNYSYLQGEGETRSVSSCVELVEERPAGGNEVYDPNEGDGQIYVSKMVLTVTGTKCTTEYKCVVFYRRSGDIIEIQEGLPTDVEAEACSPGFMNQDQLPFTSLLRASMEYRPCTAGGHHNVTSLNLKGDRDPCSKTGFREVIIRCNGDEVVEFIRDCDENDKPKEGARADFYCFGGWEEMIPYSSLPHGYGYFSDPYSSITVNSGGGGSNDYNAAGFNQYDAYGDDPFWPPENITIGYMIARPKKVDHRKYPDNPLRVCFIYIYYNETYSWTVDLRTCSRNIMPGQTGKFIFNTTKIVTCGASSAFFDQLIHAIPRLSLCAIACFFNRRILT